MRLEQNSPGYTGQILPLQRGNLWQHGTASRNSRSHELNFQNFETVQAPLRKAAPLPPPAALRFSHTDLFGEKVKWLPPYRLAPSFASADGQSIIYRRRSQVVLVGESGETHAGQATSFALGAGDTRVRIDAHGYARIERSAALESGDRSRLQRGRWCGRHGARSCADGVLAFERTRRIARISASLDTFAGPHAAAGGRARVYGAQPTPPKAAMSTDARVKAAADPQELE